MEFVYTDALIYNGIYTDKTKFILDMLIAIFL